VKPGGNEVALSAFTRTPGPRYRSEGSFSGEQWREEHLLPAYRKAVAEGRPLRVSLDGVVGFASSFLEEAFGGLVRATNEAPSLVATRLEIACMDEPSAVDAIFNKYLPDANKAQVSQILP
jgi:hypothetical protein